MRTVVDDSDPTVVYIGEQWTSQGTFQDFNRTTHATCLPGSRLTFGFSGRFVSIFGTISNTSRTTLRHAVDNNTQVTLTTPQVSEDIHQALLFAEHGLDDGDHTLEVFLVNSTISSLDEDSCLSIDFFAYHPPSASSMQICDTDCQSRDMQVHTGSQGWSDGSMHAHGGHSSSHRSPVKTALIVGLAVGVFFLALACIGFLFWHKRRGQKWQTLKEMESRGSSVTTSPTSSTRLGTIAPFLDSRPAPPLLLSVPDAPATVGVLSVGGQRIQRQRSDTMLPPYSQSEEAGRPRPNPRPRKTGGI